MGEAMNYVPSTKILLKMFLIPFIVGAVIGLISMGLSGFSIRIVTASLFLGFGFVLTITVLVHVVGPLGRVNLIILYVAVGSGLGIEWWVIVRPPWSLIIAASIGGVLSGLWAYTEKGFIEN